MDIVAKLMANDYLVAFIFIFIAIVVFKLIKKTISAIITVVLVLALLWGVSYYFNDMQDNFKFTIEDKTVTLKIMENEYEIDIDYIDSVEVERVEKDTKVKFNSTLGDDKDFTINVPNSVYVVLVRPLIKNLDIEIINK